MAAGLLRVAFDEAGIGPSVNAIHYLPRSDFGWAAKRQAHAWRTFARAMALFDAGEKLLIHHVVLANRTVSSWLTSRGEAAFPAARAREMMSVEQLNALGHEKQPLQ